jgi:hypothetical protein
MKIIFTRPNKFKLFSWLVRKIEKSQFSHCAILTTDKETLTTIVVHADKYRVRPMSFANFAKHNVIVNSIDLNKRLSPFDALEAKKFFIESYGIGYGFLTILGMLFSRIFKVRNIFADRKKTMVCSEFIIRAIKLEGIDPEIDGPQRIYEELIKCNTGHTDR